MVLQHTVLCCAYFIMATFLGMIQQYDVLAIQKDSATPSVSLKNVHHDVLCSNENYDNDWAYYSITRHSFQRSFFVMLCF
mmetsp:Transcript_11497/g.24546  ORF Transcript_11497/g.24546 Transcript_11497/m.24546 type:complete len:80 (-) Transcript_11497:237-476(-)